MSDYLDALAAQTLEADISVQPRLASRFENDTATSTSFEVGANDFEVIEESFETPVVKPQHKSTTAERPPEIILLEKPLIETQQSRSRQAGPRLEPIDSVLVQTQNPDTPDANQRPQPSLEPRIAPELFEIKKPFLRETKNAIFEDVQTQPKLEPKQITRDPKPESNQNPNEPVRRNSEHSVERYTERYLEHQTRTTSSMLELRDSGAKALSRIEPRFAPEVVNETSKPAQPTVRVTIGRLEVRVQAAPTQAVTTRQTSAPTGMSLEEYMKHRDGGSR